ncbi:MAG: hypothetical protein M3N05_08870 [Pseudomonadota bacterium]|nr:hypothetical protein [Pseudomonadota bacterium]
MTLILALLATLAAPAAGQSKPDPVTEPIWLSIPGQSLMTNCTTGYLTDPTFTGETIVMGCVVQKDGSFDQCQVKETRRAQAAHVDDVAICASAAFKIGPTDKHGKPTAGRPVLIPMAIVTGAPAAADPAPAAAPPPAPTGTP